MILKVKKNKVLDKKYGDILVFCALLDANSHGFVVQKH